MRRFILVLAVSALMAAMLVVTAVPAFATIHQLVPTDDVVANDSASAVVQDEHPPGISAGIPIGGKTYDNNSEQGDEALGSNGNFAQPLQVVDANALAEGECTRLLCGTNPGDKDDPGPDPSNLESS